MQSLSNASQVPKVSKNHISTLRASRNNVFLDEIIGPLVKGKLPEGCSILVFGPPSVGKSIFCENVVKSGLRNSLSCLYVTLDKSPCDVKHNFQRIGVNISDEGDEKDLVLVDGFSWLIGESRETYHVDNLGNLTELSIQIASAAGELSEPVFIVFDSISPLLVYNPENVVVKFLQILLARIKNWSGMGFFVLQDGVHSDSFCNTLSYLVDGIFDMKIEEEDGELSRYFRVRSLKSMAHETRWIPFAIGANREIKLDVEEEKKG